MSYLGRFQLGASVPLYLRCVNVSNAPSLPDNPPQAKIFSGTTVVEARKMPIEDRYVPNCTGTFRLPLFLGRLYAAGRYTAVYYYRVSSYYGMVEDCFDVVPGGDPRGSVVSAYFLERPEASYVVQALEDGSIIKGRNPTV